MLEFEPFLQDRDQEVRGDCDPDLSLHGVLGCAVEGFDPKMLFDPLEEDFDLPGASVKLGDGERRKLEVVAQEDESFPGFRILEPDSPQRIGDTLRRNAARSRRSSDRRGARWTDRPDAISAARNADLSADDEARLRPREAVQPSEIGVAAIHHVDRARVRNELVQQLEIRAESAGHADKGRDTSSQVEERVHLDRRFGDRKSVV